MQKNIKQDIAYAAADALIHDGMKLGLGTGSTACWVAARLAEHMKSGKIRSIRAVATSYNTRLDCERLGIPLLGLGDPALGNRLDLTIDGADEVDPARALIKGGGGALLLEKIIAYASDEFAVIVTDNKLVKHLGETFAVPVEVIPEALSLVRARLAALGAKDVVLRTSPSFAGPVYTDHANCILDARFPRIDKPADLERDLKAVPGIVESGIFTRPVNHLFVGFPDGRVEHR
jgi:ribose 5-phosphate isomerase A